MSECSDLDRSTDIPYSNKYPQLNSLSWVRNQPDAPKYTNIEPGRPSVGDSDDLSDREYQDPCMKRESPNKDFDTDLLSLDYAAYGNNNPESPEPAVTRDLRERKPSDYEQNVARDFDELRDLDLKWNSSEAARGKFAEEREKSKIEPKKNWAPEPNYDQYENKSSYGEYIPEKRAAWLRDPEPEDEKNDEDDIPLKEEPSPMNQTVTAKKVNMVPDRGTEEMEKKQKKQEENLKAEQYIVNAESMVIPQSRYEEKKGAADDFEDVEDPPLSPEIEEPAAEQDPMRSGLSGLTLENKSVVPKPVEKVDSNLQIEEMIPSEKLSGIKILQNDDSRRGSEGRHLH